MTRRNAPDSTTPVKRNFSSGWESIEAVVARREQAREILASLDGDLPTSGAAPNDFPKNMRGSQVDT